MGVGRVRDRMSYCRRRESERWYGREPGCRGRELGAGVGSGTGTGHSGDGVHGSGDAGEAYIGVCAG